MRKNSTASLLIKLSIGIYFAIQGIQSIIGYGSQSKSIQGQFSSLINSGKSDYTLLIIGILFVVAGFLLLLGVIGNIRVRGLYFIIFILWVIYLIFNYFTGGLLQPDLITWLANLSRDLIILACLWVTTEKH